MKVLCIRDDWSNLPADLQKIELPKFGNTYTVIGSNTGFYILREIVVSDGCVSIAFDKRAFTPLSTIDEREMERETLKQLV